MNDEYKDFMNKVLPDLRKPEEGDDEDDEEIPY